MAWVTLNATNQEGPIQSGFKVEANPISYEIGFKPARIYRGFDTGTIHNPTYGSGIDFPLRGAPTYNRGIAIAGRRYSGIIYP